MAKSTLPTLNSNNCATRFDNIKLESRAHAETDTVVHLQISQFVVSCHGQNVGLGRISYVLLPLMIGDTAWFIIPERIASAVQMNLPGGLLVASN